MVKGLITTRFNVRSDSDNFHGVAFTTVMEIRLMNLNGELLVCGFMSHMFELDKL